ncbi:MAG: hypothetical protein E7262_01580 [Lachnospiraceae bacterium]|nr:hypothetical protein [Lachnospiraceae bacterium]
MKFRKHLIVLCLALAGSSLIACSKSTDDGNKTTGEAVKTEKPDQSSSEGTKYSSIYTLPDAKYAFADGMYAVKFVKGSYREKDDEKTIKVKIFDYDRFSEETMKNLKKGDTLVINGKDVKVKECKFNDEYDYYEVNGGMMNDGYDFAKEGSFYRIMQMNNYYLTSEIGEVELPVSDDLLFIDHTDATTDKPIIKENFDEKLEDYIDSKDTQRSSDFELSIVVRARQIVHVVNHYVP